MPYDAPIDAIPRLKASVRRRSAVHNRVHPLNKRLQRQVIQALA